MGIFASTMEEIPYEQAHFDRYFPTHTDDEELENGHERRARHLEDKRARADKRVKCHDRNAVNREVRVLEREHDTPDKALVGDENRRTKKNLAELGIVRQIEEDQAVRLTKRIAVREEMCAQRGGA
jgi:hypothetical protein